MKKPTFRVLLLLPALWLIGAGAIGQVRPANPSASNRIPSAANRINPANDRINPAMNRIVVPQQQPTIVTPVTPGYIPPVTPVYPGTLPPGAIITSPSYLVPAYPSGWVGPTIIRETHSEPAPSAFPAPSTSSPANMPTLRVVALLGSLKQLDPATGADLGLTEARLGISIGMMVGYDQTRTVRASGDFFGVPWDGPAYFTRSEDSKAGEFLDHPLMTVNELSPSPWEFEAGIAGHSVSWMRLAVALFEDESHDPNARQPNLPRGRRAAMRDVLLRILWADKGVATPSAGTTSADSFAGGDASYFGKSLATFGEKTMTPSPDNRRIGIAEWYFVTQDMGKVLESCPRFMDVPDGAQLREARAAASGDSPAWVRPFEFRSDRDRYAGELWFVIIPDAAMNQWLQRK